MDSFGDLDKTEQLQVFKRVYTTLDSNSPDYFIYEALEGHEELEVIRAGEYLRIYCRLVMGIPQGTKMYNVLFLFYVDKHRYRSAVTRRFDRRAADRVDSVTGLETVDDVEEFLEENDAEDADYLAERINRF